MTNVVRNTGTVAPDPGHDPGTRHSPAISTHHQEKVHHRTIGSQRLARRGSAPLIVRLPDIHTQHSARPEKDPPMNTTSDFLHALTNPQIVDRALTRRALLGKAAAAGAAVLSLAPRSGSGPPMPRM